MFEPFSRSRLDKLLRLHPISAAGLAYIEQGLAAPSRNVAGTPHNMVSAIPKAKMQLTLQTESKDGERPHILEKTFDDACIGFITQPSSIELHYKGRNGRTVRTPYTPDCLAFYREIGVVIEEWSQPTKETGLRSSIPANTGRVRMATSAQMQSMRCTNRWDSGFV